MSIESCIVSIWRDTERKQLICSGLRLDNEYILSARHAFSSVGDNQVVYIGLIDGYGKEMPAHVVKLHPEMDAALLKITQSIPLNIRPELDESGEQWNTGKPVLRAVDPESHGRTSFDSYSIGGLDPETQELIVNPEDALGHSGGVVEVNGKVVGLLSRRMIDQPLCRAIPVSQLIGWLRENGYVSPQQTKAKTQSQAILDACISDWRNFREQDALLSYYLPERAEVINDRFAYERVYFESTKADDDTSLFFRPMLFQPWGNARSNLSLSPTLPAQLIDTSGLAMIMADFADDVLETSRWIYCTLSNSNVENTLPIWVSATSLLGTSDDPTTRYLRHEIFIAPLPNAVQALDKLRDGLNVANKISDASIALLIDFSGCDVSGFGSMSETIDSTLRRLLKLQDHFGRNSLSVIVTLPRHALLLPIGSEVMERAKRAWVSAPLFSKNLVDRKGQLEMLLQMAKVPDCVVSDLLSLLTTPPIGSNPEILHAASLMQCNSNGLIYALVAGAKHIGEQGDFQERLVDFLKDHHFWEPAIRLSQLASMNATRDYVPVSLDILPRSEGVYGYLERIEEVPLSIDFCILQAEVGGGKTAALQALQQAYSLPRMHGRMDRAWLPLAMTEEFEPRLPIVSELLTKAGCSAESLPALIGSPLYLLVDTDVLATAPELLVKGIQTFRSTARKAKTRLGLLLTDTAPVSLGHGSDAFLEADRLQIRPLTPKQSSLISGQLVEKLIAAWATIDLQIGQLCQNPFLLLHCSKELVKCANSSGAPDDRSLTDILASTLVSVSGQDERRKELVEELLPILAIYSLHSRPAPIFNEDNLKSFLREQGLEREYDISWLRMAHNMDLMVRTGPVEGYDFSHILYRDYFAALRLSAADDERDKVLIVASRSLRGRRWYNPLRMMLPILSDVARDNFLNDTIVSKNKELFGCVISGLRPSQLHQLTYKAVPAVMGACQPKTAIQKRFIELCTPPVADNLWTLGSADPRILPLSLSKREAREVMGQSVASQVEKNRWGFEFTWNEKTYQLSKYPVTNLEFYQFVLAGGYTRERGSAYWDSLPRSPWTSGGAVWLHETQPGRPRFWASARQQGWQALRQPNCPVVGISVYEARAYCRWLSERDGESYRLPQASEWTWAAYTRWPNVRVAMMSILPDAVSCSLEQQLGIDLLATGDMLEKIGQELANHGPAPVGITFDSASGCADLFGNVWEWCDTMIDEVRMIVRGGPHLAPSLSTLLIDGVFSPFERNELVGFRVLRELD